MKPIEFLFLVLILFCSCRKEPNYHYLEIQNRQQYVLTAGEGEPVVVFLNGGGSDLKDFNEVQNEISKITKTISYDRLGIGKSELTDSPRTLENVTEELRELLEKEGIIDIPMIFVGHSMGGYVARYFLYTYPKNVAGLVLIDPGSEFLEQELRKLQTQEEIIIADSTLNAQLKLIPKGFQMEIKAYPEHDSILKTFSINTDIPITLLESNKVDENDPFEVKLIEIQKKLYRDFQRLVPQTKIISTEKSGHFIQKDEPNLVIDAIQEMLVKVQ
ncbi:alpha/beta fold hydrolase [Allomuricauda sp. M10]|uniref:alpha/beta fold hydrolase n=1 Tax=Allomuricauda sp. M10 TaxID=2683292 RepID=UPI001D1815ED|nr:alpha/beta hydrolase [Muricauda sp. M10]